MENLTAKDLADRFHLPLAKAQRWLRSLPHISIGRRRYTTEAWLAQWMAANVKNQPRVTNFDPLEAAVMERATWLIGQLVERGKLKVLPFSNGSSDPNLLDKIAARPVVESESSTKGHNRIGSGRSGKSQSNGRVSIKLQNQILNHTGSVGCSGLAGGGRT